MRKTNNRFARVSTWFTLTVLVITLIAVERVAPATNAPVAKHQGAVRVLIAGGIDTNTTTGGFFPGLNSAEVYDMNLHTFSPTSSMSEGRVGHTATLLKTGQELLAGGDGAETDAPVASAELFDPTTETFHDTSNMNAARVGHTATLLRNGKVLLAGGQDASFTNQKTAELFEPRTETFLPTGDMNEARTGHTATLLRNGKVLIAGGENGITLLPTAELYDPASGTFLATGSMTMPRLFATATLLSDGRVLITGGGSLVGNCTGCSIDSAEIYDPASGTFSSVNSMTFPRRGHTATLLANGEVLVTGGIDDSLPDPGRFLASAELFDPSTLKFLPIANMSEPRFDHAASLLEDGTVLITGGFLNGFAATNSAELFDPSTNTFAATGTMTEARTEHTSAGLAAKSHP